MRHLHILTLPGKGKFVLVGDEKAAKERIAKPGYEDATLDSNSLFLEYDLDTAWLVANDIKKVIQL